MKSRKKYTKKNKRTRKRRGGRPELIELNEDEFKQKLQEQRFYNVIVHSGPEYIGIHSLHLLHLTWMAEIYEQDGRYIINLMDEDGIAVDQDGIFYGPYRFNELKKYPDHDPTKIWLSIYELSGEQFQFNGGGKRRTRKKRGGLFVNGLEYDGNLEPVSGLKVGDIYQFYIRTANQNLILDAAKGILIEIDNSSNREHRMKIVEAPSNYPINAQLPYVNRLSGTIMKWVSTGLSDVKIGKLPSTAAGGGKRRRRTRKKKGGSLICIPKKQDDGTDMTYDNNGEPTIGLVLNEKYRFISADTHRYTGTLKEIDESPGRIHKLHVQGIAGLKYRYNLEVMMMVPESIGLFTGNREARLQKNRMIPCSVAPDHPWQGDIERADGAGGGKRRTRKKYTGKKYPYKNITKKEAIADFIKLKSTTNPRSLNGLEIVNYGTEKLRVKTKYRGKSLIERWRDKKTRKTLKKFANRLYKGPYTDDLLHAYRSAIALSWGTLSSMRTAAALQMYKKYNAKKVLDFTAGWGSRMAAALAADIDYIGIDSNKSLKKGYNKIIKTVKKHTKSKVKLFFQPAETVNYSKLDYDFVFTSPPYEYLELYEHMKNYEGTKKIKQAHSVNDARRKNEGFYDTFLIPTIKEIYKHLPKGKWMCLNVPDLMYDKIKKKWKACNKKEDYMISKRVGSTMKSADRRGQEFVYCWEK